MENDMENTLLALSDKTVINLLHVISVNHVGDDRYQAVLGDRGTIYDHMRLSNAEFDVLSQYLKQSPPRPFNRGPG